MNFCLHLEVVGCHVLFQPSLVLAALFSFAFPVVFVLSLSVRAAKRIRSSC